MQAEKLIHSADPQSEPVVIIVFAHVVRPSVLISVPNFRNQAKQNKFQAKTMFTSVETVGLAEWIMAYVALKKSLLKELVVHLLKSLKKIGMSFFSNSRSPF